MSENLDLVRSIYEANSRGDFSSAEWAHPEIVYEIVDGPAPGRWQGLAGLAEAWRALIEVWRDLRVGLDDLRELEDGRVLALTRFTHGEGKLSGMEIGATHPESAVIFHVQADRVTRVVNYFDRDRALADLGLKE